MEFHKILTCPNCKSPLSLSENCRIFKCNGEKANITKDDFGVKINCSDVTSGSNLKIHCFDVASSGYVNLLAPGKMNNAKTGDGLDMVRARSEFLKLGLYSKIAQSLTDLIVYASNCDGRDKITVVDAGCGEGFYDLFIGEAINNCEIIGFDASKHAVAHAAKLAKKVNLHRLFFAAANIFDMPLQDECADIVISLFAPIPEAESLRVLKPNGSLIVCAAGKRHLYEFKSALYQVPTLNDIRVPKIDGYILNSETELEYKMVIKSKNSIESLLTMTPYYYKCSPADKERLLLNDNLETTVHVNFFHFIKL